MESGCSGSFLVTSGYLPVVKMTLQFVGMFCWLSRIACGFPEVAFAMGPKKKVAWGGRSKNTEEIVMFLPCWKILPGTPFGFIASSFLLHAWSSDYKIWKT